MTISVLKSFRNSEFKPIAGKARGQRLEKTGKGLDEEGAEQGLRGRRNLNTYFSRSREQNHFCRRNDTGENFGGIQLKNDVAGLQPRDRSRDCGLGRGCLAAGHSDGRARLLLRALHRAVVRALLAACFLLRAKTRRRDPRRHQNRGHRQNNELYSLLQVKPRPTEQVLLSVSKREASPRPESVVYPLTSYRLESK